MDKRVDYIDIAKGIGIILVFVGHNLTVNSRSWSWIYSFHMPLFFLISGLTVSLGKYKSYKDYLVRKINVILVPYILYTVIQLLVFYFILNSISFYSVIKIILFGWGDNPLWFLPVLFFVENIYYLVLKTQWGKLILWCMCFLLIFTFFYKGKLIYGISKIPWYFLFYSLTAIYKEKLIINFNKMKLSILFITFILLISIHYIIWKFTIELNPGTSTINNEGVIFFADFLISLFASFAILSISKVLSETQYINKLFIWVGRSTLIILCTHLMIKYTLLTFGGELLQNGWIWQPLDWLIMIMLIMIINNYIPLLSGKYELIKIKRNDT